MLVLAIQSAVASKDTASAAMKIISRGTDIIAVALDNEWLPLFFLNNNYRKVIAQGDSFCKVCKLFEYFI